MEAGDVFKSEVEDLARRLMVAMIDVYMCRTNGFPPPGAPSARIYMGDSWDVVNFNTCTRPSPSRSVHIPFTNSEIRYTRNIAGEEENLDSSKLVDKFNEIRSFVESLSRKWGSIPDPNALDPAVAALETLAWTSLRGLTDAYDGSGSLLLNITSAYSRLRGNGPRDDPDVPNYPGIDNDIEIQDPERGLYEPPALYGGAYDLTIGFIEDLYNAVDACAQVAIALHKSMEAEKELWTYARESVLAALNEICGRCDEAAKSKSSGAHVGYDEIVLVASVGLTLVGVAASGGTGGIPAAASIGLSFGTYAHGKAAARKINEDDKTICDYTSAMDATDSTFGHRWDGVISNTILEDEGTIEGSISDAKLKVRPHRMNGTSGSNVDPHPIVSVDYTRRLGVRSKERTDQVYDKLIRASQELARIAEEETRACESAIQPGDSYSNVLMRPEYIGVSQTGPAISLSWAIQLLRDRLNELAWEVDRMAENFDAAVDMLIEADTQAVERLQNVANELATGYEGP